MAQSLLQFSYNDVNYTFVDCPRKILEELKCRICMKLVFNPVQTSCGHLFCGKCIKGTETCPVDHKNFSTTPDHCNARRLGDFKVKCPNSDKGCSWLGELRAAEEHTNEICLHCNFKCPHCPHRDTYSMVTTTHLTVCELFCLPCVAGCKRSLTWREMQEHLATTCPKELVACPYEMAGCASVVKRKNLQEHMSDKDHHLQMLIGSCATTMYQLDRIIQHGLNPDVSRLLLPFRPWLQNIPTRYPRPPWVIKMEGYQEKEKNKDWFSNSVCSHFGGYKMCLKVYANGYEEVQGTHVSVFIYLMRGDDKNLKWPFKGTISVSMLNQLEDGLHHREQVWSPDSDVDEMACRRVTEGERSSSSWRLAQFICHHNLGCRGSRRCQYLKDDTIFFRVDCFEPKLD